MSSRASRRTPDTPPYLFPYNRLTLVDVSEHSFFNDEVWRFTTDVPGRSALQSVNWRLGVSDTVWLKVRFQRLLLLAKRLLLCTIVEGNPRPTTVISYGKVFRVFAIWLHAKGYKKFSEIDEGACQSWLEYVCSQYIDGDVDDDENASLKVVEQTIRHHLVVITKLLQARQHFIDLPEMVVQLAVRRWVSSKQSWTVVGAKEVESIPSVPEDVFKPTLKAALLWVDNFSNDILRLQKVEREAFEHSRQWHSHNYLDYVNRRLVGFKFSAVGPSNHEWRSSVSSWQEVAVRDESGTRISRKGPIWVLRRLISSTVAACSILIQALIGIRASELLGLEALPLNSNGWPACLELKISQDGMHEVFFVKGPITKGKRNGETIMGEWVAGIRPFGTAVLPPAVRAILLLSKLLKDWRELGEITSLFSHATSCGGGMARTSRSVARMSLRVLTKHQNLFVSDHVNVPEKFTGWHITTHQWRKKFAQDIVRCDPNAIAAVRDHFKHMSYWVLETAYLGHDLKLLEAVNSVALRDAASELVDMLDDETPFAGKAPEIVRAEAVELRRIVTSQTNRAKKIEATIEVLKSEDLRAWQCEFGVCLFRCETAKCHFRANGSFDLNATRPLITERHVDLCGSCANLSISARHADFWRRRFRKNNETWKANQRAGHISLALIAAHRTKQARDVLNSLGVSVGNEYAA
jgi:hypothetical protein